MGGDHKCPVCQATFTRPQHVARHMRSHTGDRPYKCQHCGDQFARSDLLSRHINKCHANEKPLPNQGARRKGSASASRATTSKQACDQCVQSSLPCDGSNPCAKCVQRKCRCTYVKFHRQTAPIGPGHNPRPAAIPSNILPGSVSASLSSSSRLSISYPDEFFLAPAPSSSSSTTAVPSMADSIYQGTGFSFPPLYPEPASMTAPGADFTSKYRAQAELLRSTSSNAHFAPTGGTAGGPMGPGMPPSTGSDGGGSNGGSPPTNLYAPETRPGSSWGAAVSWGHGSPDPYNAPAHPSQGTVHDKDSHHPHHYMNSHHGLQSGAGTTYQQSAAAVAYLRRGSVDFTGSDGSASGSSAASSNVHLPLDGLVNYNALDNLSDHRGDYSGEHQHSGFNGDETGAHPPPNSAVSSAFGLLSLDDPNLLSGFANEAPAAGVSAPSFFPPQDMGLNGETNMNMPLTGLTSVSGIPADDPDATPMPLKETLTTTVPSRSASAGGLNASAPKGEGDLQLREFWKQYMRTPSSVDGSVASSSSTSQHVSMTPPRRPRVASMPSSGKTPTIAVSLQQQHSQQQQEGGRGESGVRTTLNEDLRSYEAAVLARKAPTNLNLVPKMRRGTVPALAPAHHHHGHQHSSASPVDTGFQHRPPPPGRGNTVVAGKGVGVVPLVNLEVYGGGDNVHGLVGSRPGSSSTSRSGSSGDGGSGSVSSSLADAFGAHPHDNQHLHPSSYPPPHRQQQQYQQQQQQHGASSHRMSSTPSSFTLRRGSPSTSSTSTTGGSSSRASSVATDHGDSQDADVEIGGVDEGNEDSPDDNDSDGRHRHPRLSSSSIGAGDNDARRRKRNVDSVGRLRPAFKRLASTTLGPASAKRQFLVPPGGGPAEEDESTREMEGGMGSMGMGGAMAIVGVDGFAPGALGMK